MTTPVVTYKDDDKLTVSKPSEKEVFINELKKSLYGAIRFKGSWTDKNFDKYDQILVDYLLSNNYEILSARLILRYQLPFILGMFRRNEIAYQIR